MSRISFMSLGCLPIYADVSQVHFWMQSICLNKSVIGPTDHGRMGIKLFQVIPHLWFSNWKKTGKTPSQTKSPSISKSSVTDATSRSPSRGFLMQKGDNTDHGQHPQNIDKCSDFHHTMVDGGGGCMSAPDRIIPQCYDTERERGRCSLCLSEHNNDSQGNNNSHQGKNAACFDVLELEGRLKALRSGERRKSPCSPTFTVAVPTPTSKNNEILGDEIYTSRHPRAMVDEIADAAPFIKASESISCRQSTSSSSTAPGRASSREWDVFTSKVSESLSDEPNYLMSASLYQSIKPITVRKNSSLIQCAQSNGDRENSSNVYGNEVSVPPSCMPAYSQVTAYELTEAHMPKEEIVALPHYISNDLSRMRRECCHCNSKEAVLHSARPSFEQPIGYAHSGNEQLTSNYAKFKMERMRNAHRKYDHVLKRSSSYHYCKESEMKKQDETDNTACIHTRGCGKSHNEKDLVGQITENMHQVEGTLNAMKERENGLRIKASSAFDSVAVMKCSHDPWQDFKQSMMEMIIGSQLHTPKHMVDLLQCYLALNDDVYHKTIIKAMREVWADLFQSEVM